MTDRLQRLNTVFLFLFGIVALALAYWGIIRAPGLLARDDNPRLVEAELRVQRGRILDRNGIVLAETVGELGALERRYHLPAAPAVGYYSLRYGVSGVEAAYDDLLRGRSDNAWDDWLNSLLHRYPVGQDVQLTLDAELQAVADAALGSYRGAAVLLDARSGDILALASHPSYDPSLLDEQFDKLNDDENAPLLNRATQGLYQPGTALQPLLLAAGLEQGLVQLDAPVRDPAAPVKVGGLSLSCVAAPSEVTPTLTTALASACPAPFADLALVLGSAGLVNGLADFGLFETPVNAAMPLELAPATEPDLAGGEAALIAEAVGQGELTVSPLQMAWAMAAIANEGERPPLRLVRRTGSETAGWEIVIPSTPAAADGLSSQTAAAVTQAMVVSDTEQIAGHMGVAIAGPGGRHNSWFLGFAPAEASRPLARYVVVVLLENTADANAAATIGKTILESLNL